MSGHVTALIGAQFGSEGKGLIAEKIASAHSVHIRTGAPNAGHTYFVDWKRSTAFVAEEVKAQLGGEPVNLTRKKVVARSVPCGAANPDATLVIGPGGLVDLDLLIEEVRELDALGLDVSSRLFVDRKAMLIDPVRHHGLEGGVDGDAHRLIGSTGEGVGPARMAKIARGTFRDWAWAKIEQVASAYEQLAALGVSVADTAMLVNTMYDAGASILLEGTQGSGLSLVHGPWPYCTSSDTNAGQLAVDAGLAPQLVDDVLLVARTFPIRVAGNSGPLPAETNWAMVGQPEERTTVTKKVRRVAEWTDDLVRRAIMLNRPSRLALTFFDYAFPDAAGATSVDDLQPPHKIWLYRLEQRMGVPVAYVGTGPDTAVAFKWPDPIGLSPSTLPWPTDLEAYGAVPS